MHITSIDYWWDTLKGLNGQKFIEKPNMAQIKKIIEDD